MFRSIAPLFVAPMLALAQEAPAVKPEPAPQAEERQATLKAAEQRDSEKFLQLPAQVRESKRRFTPYFDIGLNQGLFVPTSGLFFSGTNMETDFGFLTNIAERHSVFGLYRFDYKGPGFQFQDGKEFQSRSLGHGFLVEYRYKPFDAFRIRPGVSKGLNYARTVSNEIWGEGLYDYEYVGGQLAVDWLPRWGFITGQFLYRKLEFPNYTDLLREFQNVGTQSELAGGLQDQKVYEFSIHGRWRMLFGGVRYSVQNFINEKVIERSGTMGAYGSTPQKDTNLTLSAGAQLSLWRFEAAPQANYSQHRSNQNFLRFKFFGDNAPAFIERNYDYDDIAFQFPLYLNLTKKYALKAAFSQNYRGYKARPPRDADNNYTPGTQKNLMTTFGGGIRSRLNEISFLHLNYGFVVAKSNNHFERYLPYNYTGHTVSFGYTLAY